MEYSVDYFDWQNEAGTRHAESADNRRPPEVLIFDTDEADSMTVELTFEEMDELCLKWMLYREPYLKTVEE